MYAPYPLIAILGGGLLLGLLLTTFINRKP
jgi:hypothetical protein